MFRKTAHNFQLEQNSPKFAYQYIVYHGARSAVFLSAWRYLLSLFFRRTKKQSSTRKASDHFWKNGKINLKLSARKLKMNDLNWEALWKNFAENSVLCAEKGWLPNLKTLAPALRSNRNVIVLQTIHPWLIEAIQCPMENAVQLAYIVYCKSILM